MESLIETIEGLSDQVTASGKRRMSLEDALFELQRWVESNAARLTPDERQAFSALLRAEKQAPDDSQSSDHALVASVLRLHTMRLLYRHDKGNSHVPPPEDDTAYAKAKHRLLVTLREVEQAVNEARIDTAIANAHHILSDPGANRRWLNDALAHLSSIAGKDLVRMAGAIPEPELPELGLLRGLFFRLFGIKREEISRRTVNSLRQMASLQHGQIAELSTLLADSFSTIGDKSAAQQARQLAEQFRGKGESEK